MVCVVDNHAKTGEEQHDRHADSQSGVGFGPSAGLQSDREQTRSAVDEGCDEHAEDDLCARSRRKLRSSRGENWVEESCNATTVRPRTRAITVTTVLLTAISRERASSAVPWKAIASKKVPGWTTMWEIASPAMTAMTAATLGNTQSDPAAYSRA